MGFIAGELRLMMLTNEVNTLQARLTNLTQTKSDMAEAVEATVAQISELDSDDATVKQLHAKKAQYEAMEKRIDSQIKAMETKISRATSELQQAEQMVARGIQTSTPKYCGVGGGQ